MPTGDHKNASQQRHHGHNCTASGLLYVQDASIQLKQSTLKKSPHFFPAAGRCRIPSGFLANSTSTVVPGLHASCRLWLAGEANVLDQCSGHTAM